MYHFFVQNNQITEHTIKITGSDVNHMKNVLRMHPGEKFQVSDQEGQSYLCELTAFIGDAAEAGILSAADGGTELPARLYLFQGLPKGDKMELIIQKAVELGVFQVIPVAMKRSVVKLDPKKAEAKCKRWSGISESAAKQSKRGTIPEIGPVMTFKEALAYAKALDLLLLPYENAEGMEGTRRLVEAVKPGMQIGIFIGPEGGFDDSEVADAVGQSWNPITLGKRILRTETAGLTVLSILMYHLEQIDTGTDEINKE